MHIVVDAVAPGVPPSVRFEQILDHGGRIVALVKIDRAPIDDQRPSRMVGDEAVVLEADRVGLSRPREIRSLPSAWPPQAGRALGVPLQVFKYRHDRPPLSLRADIRSTAAGAAPERPRAQIPRRRRWPSAPAPRRASARGRPQAPGPPAGGRPATCRPRMPARPCAARGRRERHPCAYRRKRCHGRARRPSCGPGRVWSNRRFRPMRQQRRRDRDEQRMVARAPQRLACAHAKRSSRPWQEPAEPFRRRPRSGRGRPPPARARYGGRSRARIATSTFRVGSTVIGNFGRAAKAADLGGCAHGSKDRKGKYVPTRQPPRGSSFCHIRKYRYDGPGPLLARKNRRSAGHGPGRLRRRVRNIETTATIALLGAADAGALFQSPVSGLLYP